MLWWLLLAAYVYGLLVSLAFSASWNAKLDREEAVRIGLFGWFFDGYLIPAVLAVDYVRRWFKE